MGKTTFSGPVRVGKDTGAGITTTLGIVPVVQSVVVSAAAKKAFIAVPPNSQLIDVYTIIDTAVAGSAASYTVRIGVSADEDQYATMSVSGKNIYRPTTSVSGISWKSLGTSAANLVTVDATVATSSTTGAFAGVVHIVYKPGS